MNKLRFSDQRLAQISSLKELRNTKMKINNRIEVLEDKFEHNRWSVFNIDGAMQGLAHKIESVREAWERIVEAARSVREKGEKCMTKAKEKIKDKVAEKVKETKTRAKRTKKSADTEPKQISEQPAPKQLPATEPASEPIAQEVVAVEAVEIAGVVSETTQAEGENSVEAKSKSRRRRSNRRRKPTDKGISEEQ
jgi:hypothetical protein